MSFSIEIQDNLLRLYGVTPENATSTQLYNAVSAAAMRYATARRSKQAPAKRACYFSAEFLVGRLVDSNLFNLGLLGKCRDFFAAHGIDSNIFEQIDDDALGNGGLGRLAACFLDSAATHGIPLDGYGIRYRYGLFRQAFVDGFQKELVDDWQRFGDPWSVRREEDAVTVTFADQTVRAVPYDMPVIGYGESSVVNTLRLWQAEPLEPFDLALFNQQHYDEAVHEKTAAEAISQVLYPNDDTMAGKRLRLKQQYFFSSASLQSIMRTFVRTHGENFEAFPGFVAIQLNDTHPTVSIPELLRLLIEEYFLDFESAFNITAAVFAYTNHTVMAEALEKWETSLFMSVLPHVYPYVVMLNNRLRRELVKRGVDRKALSLYSILSDNMVHMARMAVYSTHSVNGVARIHTKILKTTVLAEWHALYPERFNNKTNGVTQRRWLALCNPELSALLTEKIGTGWATDLMQLKPFAQCAQNSRDVARFMDIKRLKKEQLGAFIEAREGVPLDADWIFDVQIKRLHEYKRQLLNAFSILNLYFEMREARLTDFYPTVFLFGAKAAPGYRRAKGIIKFINEVSRLIDADEKIRRKLKILFVTNYDVTYAEKLIPTADVSVQISTAGTEASGTGNMKLMLNGAVTLGTLDGANIEIIEQAGAENNYIFGATVDEIASISDSYSPRALYEASPCIQRVVNTLVDGTLDDGGTGMFRELYDSLLKGASWHKPDQYFLLQDFRALCDTRLRLNHDYRVAPEDFARKCMCNTANAGPFSSDRTIHEYAKEIWGV